MSKYKISQVIDSWCDTLYDIKEDLVHLPEDSNEEQLNNAVNETIRKIEELMEEMQDD